MVLGIYRETKTSKFHNLNSTQAWSGWGQKRVGKRSRGGIRRGGAAGEGNKSMEGDLGREECEGSWLINRSRSGKIMERLELPKESYFLSYIY